MQHEQYVSRKCASLADFWYETIKTRHKIWSRHFDDEHNAAKCVFYQSQHHASWSKPWWQSLWQERKAEIGHQQPENRQRINEELKRQGRNVSWLARQLCMERTSLYYTFRQNSIDVELLLRISSFLGHNFMQDVAEMLKHTDCEIKKITDTNY